ncbi:MAG: hypothetical protein ACK4XK_12835 [Casimicrobiaceae bacterium]
MKAGSEQRGLPSELAPPFKAELWGCESVQASAMYLNMMATVSG